MARTKERRRPEQSIEMSRIEENSVQRERENCLESRREMLREAWSQEKTDIEKEEERKGKKN